METQDPDAGRAPTQLEAQTGAGGWGVGALLGFAALLAVLFTLDDPGLTVDEPINVGHGVRMISLLLHEPAGLLTYQKGRPDHPPLARLLIGLSHHLLAGELGPGRIACVFGRPASAAAFAMAVMLCTVFGCRLGGKVCGVCSGLALLLMPRIFAHAHMASPEVVSAAFCFASFQAAAWAFAPADGAGRTWLRVFPAGVVLGLALLTKLTAVLVPLGVSAAVLTYYRHRKLAPLAAWGLTGLVVFLAGWPLMWPTAGHGGFLGAAQRLVEFLSVGVQRATIYTWYFGRQYPAQDAPVPWHYALFYFLATVPIALQLAGLLMGAPALWRRRKDWPCWILLVSIVCILAFFTLPIDRYDGDRLLLVVFPLWAVAIGLGLTRLWQAAEAHASRRWLLAAGIVLVASQAYGVVHYHPVQLSYYNALVGGLAGADSLGLEATYWGDSLTEDFLDQFAKLAEEEECAELRPTLYAGHPVLLTSPQMQPRRVRILPQGDDADRDCRWVVVFNRRSYLEDARSQELLNSSEPVLEYAVDGVWLSRVYRNLPGE